MIGIYNYYRCTDPCVFSFDSFMLLIYHYKRNVLKSPHHQVRAVHDAHIPCAITTQDGHAHGCMASRLKIPEGMPACLEGGREGRGGRGGRECMRLYGKGEINYFCHCVISRFLVFFWPIKGQCDKNKQIRASQAYYD